MSWFSGVTKGISKAVNTVGNYATDLLGLNSSYEKVGNGAADYSMYDYNGNMQNAYNTMGNAYNSYNSQLGNYASNVGSVQSSYNPTSYMNSFLNSTSGLSNAVSGENSALQQSLNALAKKQATADVNTQAQNFAGMGALNSGAAAAAMGEASSNPYAQAQATLQQNQLQGTLGLYNNAMNNYAQGYQTQGAQNLQAQQANQNANLNTMNMYGNLANSALQNYGALGSGFGTIVAPTYASQGGWGANLLSAAGSAANAYKTFQGA